MSDHLDAPGLKSPNMDARVDITDIYAFQKPGDPGKSILVLNVNPFAPTLADSFAPDARYEMNVDTNGDAFAEVTFRITFSPLTDGEQKATVHRAMNQQEGAQDSTLEVILQDAPVSFGREAGITTAGDYTFFAGLRSDPFFFDLNGFLGEFAFTGEDAFLDKNVFGIVLEMPNSVLSTHTQIGFWCRVLLPRNGEFVQIDRMGRPFINILFMQGEDKNAFNRIQPTQDRELFLEKVITALQSSGYRAEQASEVASLLLPDILPYNYSSSEGYPNGRLLTDDITDTQLALATNGKVTSDKVGPHTDLLSSFPYLGVPH